MSCAASVTCSLKLTGERRGSCGCSKSFDTEMCPLPFPVEKMYHFLLERFDKTVAAVQDQNLQWLQVINKFSSSRPREGRNVTRTLLSKMGE